MMNSITFVGATGHQLSAKLDMPSRSSDEGIKAYALLAHCFSCSKDMYAMSRIAGALKAQGVAVFRFDFTGLGQSNGDFADTNFSTNVADLVTAATYMRKNHEAPSIVIGHSLGGAAVLVAAHQIPEADAIVTIGAPAEVAHVAHHFDDARAKIMEHGEANVNLAGRPFTIKKQFLEDIEKVNLQGMVGSLKRALLVMHAPTDITVGIENAGKIFGWAKHPKSFVSLDDADHLLTDKKDAEYAANVIAAWAGKYIGNINYSHFKK